MLLKLTVSNLAIVEKAEVDFGRGLNVLTGETGSGKSVIMSALALALGARADSSMLRDGEQDCRIEAVFDISGSEAEVDALLSEAGIGQCESSELVIRRTISSSGTAKAWVNDSRTTVATLKALSSCLVDIHGARSNQKLLEEPFQRMTIDSYGRIDTGEYSAAWDALAAKRAEIERLMDGVGSEDELDMLRYQVNELQEAGLSAEDADISERHAAAAHAGEILELANGIFDVLGGERSVSESLVRLQPRFAQLSRYLPEASAWAQESEDITVKLQELSRTMAGAISRIDADPSELEALDARLAVINRLKRKYLKGAPNTVEALLDVLASKRARLESMEDFDNVLERLRKEEALLFARVKAEGEKLTGYRKSAGAKFSRHVTCQLKDLGFLQSNFHIAFKPSEPSRHGTADVCFMFEPNPGESARELADVASSGEIARVMLALKSIMALNDGAQTVVFDEIDANIGGDIARAAGEKMRAVAGKRQVIAITHQPQSAVFAENHLVVSKSVVKGRTLTRIVRVDGDERVSEIARMLGGGAAESVVREHARELLSIASN